MSEGHRPAEPACRPVAPIRQWYRPILVSLLLLVIYANVLVGWMQHWWDDEGYSHGFLAAAIALFIAWRQRLATLSTPLSPSSNGLYLSAAASVAYVVGRLGAEFFITRMSFLLMISGIVWTFWGMPRLRRLAFPLLLLASVVPPPVILYNKISAPLQLLASSVATRLAQALGASVYRDGNIIQLANTTLGVAEACSGLRSLESLLVGALLLGYVEELRLGKRVLVLVLAIPVAILFNVLRVTGTAMLAEKNPDLAMGLYHSLSGWMFFVAGFSALYGTTKLLRSFHVRREAQA